MRQYGPFEIYLKAVFPLSWKMALLVLSDTNFWCNCLYKRKFHETKLSFFKFARFKPLSKRRQNLQNFTAM